MILVFLAGDLARELALQEALRLPKAEAVERLDSLYKATGDPKFLSAKIDLISQIGDLKRALKEAKRGIKSHPSEPVFWEHLVRIAYNMGDKWTARRALDGALKRFPDQPRLLHLAGILWDNEGDYRKAEEFYRKAYALAPDSLLWGVHLASLLVRTGRSKEALSVLETVAQKLPPAETLSLEGPGIARFLEIKNLLYELHLVWGLAHDNLSGYRDAAAHYTEALKVRPWDPKVSMRLGVVLWKLGLPDSGLKVVQGALERHPGNVSLHKVAGILAYEGGRYSLAAAELGLVATLAPNDAQARLYLARALLRLGKVSDALREARRALSLNPSLENFNYVAYLEARSGDFEGSLRTLLRVVDSGNAYTYTLVAASAERSGRFRIAERYLRKAIEANPRDTAAYRRMVDFLRARGREADAGPYLRRLAELKGDDPFAWFELAMWLSRWSSDTTETSAAFARAYGALKADSSWHEDRDKVELMAHVCNNWAFYLLEHGGDPERAFKLAKEALGLMPDDPGCLDTVGWALYKMGRLEEAYGYLKRAAELLREPDPEIESHLKQVEKELGK